MANLDVVPKRRIGAWVRIVLALVVIALLWIMLGSGSHATRTGRLGGPGASPLTSAATFERAA